MSERVFPRDEVVAVQITVPISFGRNSKPPSYIANKAGQVSLSQHQRRALHVLTKGLDLVGESITDIRFSEGERRVTEKTTAIRWLLESIEMPSEMLEQFEDLG